MSNTQHEHTWTINNDGDWAHCDCGKSGYPVFIAADNERRAEQIYNELREDRQRFASALRVIRRKALEQVNTKSPEWAINDTLKRIAITVDYAIGINATKEQPMSDTLQEREDQAMNNDDFCDECHSYKHMPWCSSYTEPDIYDAVAELREQQATSEHQPAAPGGGDEVQRIRQRVKVGLCAINERSDDPYNLSTRLGDTEYLLDQHQSLVAERERLETLLNDITTRAKFALSTPGFIRDRDGLQKAVDAIEQRSTSE